MSVERTEPPGLSVKFCGVRVPERAKEKEEPTERLTFPENPSILVVVMVRLPEPPRGIDRKPGLGESWKLGPVTVTKTVA